MKITYKDRKIEEICTDYTLAKKRHGVSMAGKIHQRIKEIRANDTVETMIEYGIGRCHLLKGDRKGEYAMDLIHPYRLVFEKHGKDVQIAHIMEIVDYHQHYHRGAYYACKSNIYCYSAGTDDIGTIGISRD